MRIGYILIKSLTFFVQIVLGPMFRVPFRTMKRKPSVACGQWIAEEWDLILLKTQ